MKVKIVRIDGLADAIKEEINAMNEEVIKNCNNAAETVAKEGVRQLKATSPVRNDGRKRKYPPGSYAKSWKYRKDTNELGVTGVTIYNAKHYQLTHLLEFGHIDAKTGKRTKKFPHIADVNNEVARRFVEEVEGMKL